MACLFALVCGLICVAACSHGKSKDEQLAALETAKESGALSDQEYEAKKAAITGTSAPAASATPASDPSAGAKATNAEEAEPEPAPAAGCNDPEYKSHKAGPAERFFPLPEARVKTAVLAALKTLDFTIHKDDGGEIEASKNRHVSVMIGAGGERELILLEAAEVGGKQGTRVKGETKKKLPTQKSWSAAILAQIACNLK
jgi:hypothetical protein